MIVADASGLRRLWLATRLSSRHTSGSPNQLFPQTGAVILHVPDVDSTGVLDSSTRKPLLQLDFISLAGPGRAFGNGSAWPGADGVASTRTMPVCGLRLANDSGREA